MDAHNRIWLQLACVGLLSSSVVACSDSPTAPPPDEALHGEIVVPLRLHLLRSSQSTSLNAPLTVEQAQTLVRDVNTVWAQANIRWSIEVLVEDDAILTPNVVNAFSRPGGADFPVLLEAIGGDPADTGWDAYLVRDFGGAGFAGVYFTGSGIAFAKLADGAGEVDLVDFGTRVLAHELGHSLSLAHVACPPQGNLMAAGCLAQVRTGLTEAQVAAARRQAQTGRPF